MILNPINNINNNNLPPNNNNNNDIDNSKELPIFHLLPTTLILYNANLKITQLMILSSTLIPTLLALQKLDTNQINFIDTQKIPIFALFGALELTSMQKLVFSSSVHERFIFNTPS